MGLIARVLPGEAFWVINAIGDRCFEVMPAHHPTMMVGSLPTLTPPPQLSTILRQTIDCDDYQEKQDYFKWGQVDHL
jgi:hypothetical protein